MSTERKQAFAELPEFTEAMNKLVAVPKSVIEQREREWQAAKKKAKKKR